jgi:N-methylhydantoinase B
MVVDHIIVDLVFGALAKVIPDKVMADSCGCIYDVISAVKPNGERGIWIEVVAGGLGARPTKDGVNVMACHVTNCPNNPIEASEMEFPLLFLQRELRPDSGGAGRYRGGLGQILSYKVLGDKPKFSNTSQKAGIPPQPLFGGKPGTSGIWIVNEGRQDERRLQSINDEMPLNKGDTVTLLTAGGGGYGNPLDRDVEAVLHDVKLDYISIETAREDYKVIIDP